MTQVPSGIRNVINAAVNVTISLNRRARTQVGLAQIGQCYVEIVLTRCDNAVF